jgi:hypothetical protein
VAERGDIRAQPGSQAALPRPRGAPARLRAARRRCVHEAYRLADRGRRVQGFTAFKQLLALTVPDLTDYGQIKAPATEILMAAAERWAADSGWEVLRHQAPNGG